MNVLVRKYEECDAEQISNIIIRNLFEINIKDHKEEEIKKQAEKFKTEDIIRKFQTRITYVATYECNVIGTASISNHFVEDKNIYWLLTVFVLPEYHKKGVGKILLEKLEQKARELNAKKIIVEPSNTAKDFYRKLGYEYGNDINLSNEKNNMLMEKDLHGEMIKEH